MNRSINKIAYLAPELPSLSATFVTNEIWALEAKGIEIHPFSVHKPGHQAHGKQAEELADRTMILYDRSISAALISLLKLFVMKPVRLTKTKAMLIADLFRVGVLTIQSVKLAYQFLRGADLALQLMEKGTQHLHIHFAHVPTQIGMYAASMAGIPYSFMVHANDIFERPLLIKEKVARSHQTMSISQFNIELMKKKGAEMTRIEIVRCGVDANQYGDLAEKQDSHSDFVIGTIGRLVEKKGIDTLIDAAKLLKDKGHMFRVEIAGDGPLLTELEAQVRDLKLEDRVQFLGALPHIEVMKWMKQLNAFVLAGKKDRNGDMDGIPVVLMEAMMLGIPVISTKLSGIPELVIHEETGLIGAPGSAVDLAKNLIRYIGSPVLLDRLVPGARHRIESEFDRSLNADRLIRIFNHKSA